MTNILIWGNENLPTFINTNFKIDLNIPIVVQSKLGYEDVAEGGWTNFQNIFIQLENKWWKPDMPINNYLGFKIIYNLRVEKKYRGNIIMLSVLDRENVVDVGNMYSNIIGKPYHDFLHLNGETTNVKSWLEKVRNKVMKEEVWSHISRNSYNYIHRLSLFVHQLNNDLKDKNKRALACFEKAFSSIEMLILPSKKSLWEKTKIEFVERVGDAELSALSKEFKEKILSLKLIAHSDEDSHENNYKSIEWNVLLVDDDKPILKEVKSRLNRVGINCIAVDNVGEAIEVLKSDFAGELPIIKEDYDFLKKNKHEWSKKRKGLRFYPKNSILIVISDLMFFINQNPDDWQDLQGYDLIDIIASDLGNTLSIFMLTSDRTYSLEQAGKPQFIQVRYKIKDNVGLDGVGLMNEQSSQAKWDYFVKDIIDEGERNYLKRLNQPKSGGWKAMLPLYRMHHNSWDYYEAEKYINEEVIKLSERFIGASEKGQEFFDHDFSFGKKIRLGPNENTLLDDENLNIFRMKLIGRRVYIALAEKLGMDKIELYLGVYTKNEKMIVMNNREWMESKKEHEEIKALRSGSKLKINEFIAENHPDFRDCKYFQDLKGFQRNAGQGLFALALSTKVQENILLEEKLFVQQYLSNDLNPSEIKKKIEQIREIVLEYIPETEDFDDNVYLNYHPSIYNSRDIQRIQEDLSKNLEDFDEVF